MNRVRLFLILDKSTVLSQIPRSEQVLGGSVKELTFEVPQVAVMSTNTAADATEEWKKAVEASLYLIGFGIKSTKSEGLSKLSESGSALATFGVRQLEKLSGPNIDDHEKFSFLIGLFKGQYAHLVHPSNLDWISKQRIPTRCLLA